MLRFVAIESCSFCNDFEFDPSARITQNVFELKVYHRDVCANGFNDDLDGKADAVFLDLPGPHDVVPYALKAIKSSGIENASLL